MGVRSGDPEPRWLLCLNTRKIISSKHWVEHRQTWRVYNSKMSHYWIFTHFALPFMKSFQIYLQILRKCLPCTFLPISKTGFLFKFYILGMELGPCKYLVKCHVIQGNCRDIARSSIYMTNMKIEIFWQLLNILM